MSHLNIPDVFNPIPPANLTNDQDKNFECEMRPSQNIFFLGYEQEMLDQELLQELIL